MEAVAAGQRSKWHWRKEFGPARNFFQKLTSRVTDMLKKTVYSEDSLSEAHGSDSVKILLDESGQPSFEENASARKLAFFNLNVLGQLLNVTDSLSVETVLLDKAESDFERKEYVLKLRSGIRFHNGRIATAKDLEFTIVRGFFSENRSFYRTYIGGIEGIEDAVVGKYKTGIIRGVRIIDDLTIGVKLKHPNPTFLHSLAHPFFSLVPQEALDDSYIRWKEIPVGAGPYRVIEPIGLNSCVRIEKVSKESPGPQTVDLYTLDLAPHYDVSLVKHPKVTHESSRFGELPGTILTLFLSQLNALSADVNFRKALVHGIDREAIAKLIPGSKPTWELLPSYFSGRTGENIVFDLNKSRLFVAKIAHRLRQTVWKIELFNGPDEAPPFINEIIDQLDKIGLKFKYQRGVDKFASAHSANEIPLFVAGQVTDFIDPLMSFAAFLPSGHDPYLTFESDPEFENAYAKASDSIEFDSRIETIKNLSHQLSEKIICIPLLERRLPIYYDSKKVKQVDMWGNLGLFTLQDLELNPG